MTGDGHKIIEFLEQVLAMVEAFGTKLDAIDKTDEHERLAALLSSTLDLKADWDSFASDPGSEGLQLPILPKMRTVSDKFQSGEVTVGEYRTKILSSAYHLDLEVPSAWSNASRADRALLNAVWYEHLVLHDENIIPSDDLGGDELERAEARLATAMETFRKSVYRYRQKVRGQKLFEVDRVGRRVGVVDAEEVFFKHLPNRPGPPPKSD